MSKKIVSIFSNPILQNSLAIVITGFFLVFIILFFLIPAIQKAEDDAVNLQQKAAIDAQHLIELFLQTRFEDLSNTGNHIWFHYKNVDKEDIKAASEIFFESKTDFINISLLDNTGKTLLSIDKPGIIDATPSSFLKDNLSFKKPFVTGEKYISPVYFGPHGPSLQISIPLKDSEKIIGVIVADIDFTILWKVVRTPQVNDGKIYLVDTRGYIIADSDQNRSVSGENLKYRSVVNKIVAGEIEVPLAVYINENHSPVLSYGLKIPLTGWGIIVEQDIKTALLQKNRTTTATLGFSSITIILIFLLLLGTYRLSKALMKVKHEEETISAERNKLAVILSGISDAVIALDLNRNIVLFNKTAEKLTGYKNEAILGKNIGSIIRIYELSESNHDLTVGSTVEKELLPDTYSPIQNNMNEGVIFSKNGLKIRVGKKEAFVNLLAGHISEGLATNLGCILTMHDITQEKQLEQMKLDFVSMAAHELRTPLTNMIGYMSTLDIQAKSKLDSKEKTFLERSLISAQQLNNLVDNLLNISKIENKVMSLTRQSLDLEQQLLILLEDFKSKAHDKGINIKLNIPNPIPRVLADPIRINEVLNNLMDNAFKFTKTGGEIEISAHVEKNYLITSIRNTGIGIPEDAIPHLFTKFFRVAGALDKSSNSKGTGLGLYISKAIIDAHEGKIWVQSILGKEATFSFSLPVFL